MLKHWCNWSLQRGAVTKMGYYWSPISSFRWRLQLHSNVQADTFRKANAPWRSHVYGRTYTPAAEPLQNSDPEAPHKLSSARTRAQMRHFALVSDVQTEDWQKNNHNEHKKNRKKMCECNKYSYKLHLNVKIVSFGINIYITLNILNLPRRIYGAQTHCYLSGLSGQHQDIVSLSSVSH